MRILVAHVRYRRTGGEDVVVDREVALMRGAGIDVRELVVRSEELKDLPFADQCRIALNVGAHGYGKEIVAASLDEHSPDVVHAHNLFPLLGVSPLSEAARRGIPTVHTWHNYRASCLAGTHLYRDGVCTACSVRSHAMGVYRGCYRGSRLQSAAYARGIREQLRSLRLGVPDRVICLTEFQQRMYLEQGVTADSIVVKPNSVADGAPIGWAERSGAAFVGRLSAEKGILGLLEAWPEEAAILDVVGAGPLEALVRESVRSRPNIAAHGMIAASDVRAMMRKARVIAMPSLCFEGLPMTLLEALSEGTPVVVFGGGALEEIPSVHVVPHGDYRAFVQTVQKICDLDRAEWDAISDESLDAHRRWYSDDKNIEALLGIYQELVST